MSTHNICFHGEIRKILCGYPLLSVAKRGWWWMDEEVKITFYQNIIMQHIKLNGTMIILMICKCMCFHWWNKTNNTRQTVNGMPSQIHALPHWTFPIQKPVLTCSTLHSYWFNSLYNYITMSWKKKSKYSRTSMARTSLEPWKLVRDMGSSSDWGLIMAPDQEANSDNLGKSFLHFLHSDCMLCVLIRIASKRWF